MIHYTAKIVWSNGDKLTAELSARSPESLNPVAYSGTLSRRTPDLPDRSNHTWLEASMRILAHETGGVFTDEFSGLYAFWAE
jgi:hypothetical protein